MAFSIAQALNRIVAHQDLTHEEMIEIMRLIMSGQASPVLTAGLLMALRVKVETTTEVAAADEEAADEKKPAAKGKPKAQ